MFRGGNLEIVERRWILIASECKAGSGMGYVGSYLLAFDRIDRIGIVFSFFLFFFVFYWREISILNPIEGIFLFLEYG